MMLFSKIPRTRLYLKNSELVKSLFTLITQGPSMGAPVELFEHQFAQWSESRYAVAASYARICFFYILKNLPLTPGCEVITTPITIHDMINMIICAGHRPRFIDINEVTYQMDPDALEKAINPRTQAVLVTHLFGMPSDMDRIVSICKKHKLQLIEDCSHGFGARSHDKPIGTFGKAGFYSLSSLKSISSGYGGIAVSEDQALIESIKNDLKQLRKCNNKDLSDILRKSLVIGMATASPIFPATFSLIKLLNRKDPALFARLQTDNPERKLYNTVPEKFLWKFSQIQSDLCLQCLKRVDKENNIRIKNASILYDMLKEPASDRIPKLLPESKNVFWRFPFRAPEGKQFVHYMNQRGIDIAQTLLPCCTSENVFKDFYSPTPNAQKAVKDIYFLPVEHTLTELQITKIGNAVRTFLKR